VQAAEQAVQDLDMNTRLEWVILAVHRTGKFFPLHQAGHERRVWCAATVASVSLWAAGAALLGPEAAVAGQISISGELRSTVYQKESLSETKTFQATFDENACLISYSAPPLPRYNLPTYSNIVFVSREYNAVVSLFPGERAATASLRKPEYAWQLGNLRDGLASRAFMAIRCLELFPQGSGAQSRPLAVASAVGGEPFSLISEAEYDYAQTSEGRLLTCEVRVSKSLRDRWRSSPLLDPGLVLDSKSEAFRLAEISIAPHPSGFLLERIRFSKFTNVAGVCFPTVAEFWKYAPPRMNRRGPAVQGVPFGEATLRLTLVAHSASGSIGFPHLEGLTKITVAEERLTDRALHIGAVTYETNALASLEISPLARAEFARAVHPARSEKVPAHLPPIVRCAMVAALLAGLVLIWKRMRWRVAGSRQTQAPCA
jgi:hypothetical protein